MGETVQKIQAFSLSIAFMDKSRKRGGLRGDRNWSVFDAVYPVILTVHSAFGKPSTWEVTPPPQPTLRFYCWGFFSLRGKQSRVPFGSASSQCFVGHYRQETGRVQQFCWVTQQGHELPNPHRAAFLPRNKHLPVQKYRITSRSADSKI